MCIPLAIARVISTAGDLGCDPLDATSVLKHFLIEQSIEFLVLIG